MVERAIRVYSASPEPLTIREKVDNALSEIRDEYLQQHRHPWVVGFSGGKDSTLLLHLALEMLGELPSSAKTRPIHVVSNDTLVESPVLMSHIDDNLEKISAFAAKNALPLMAEKTVPDPNQTFWVNLIGRGYPSPNQTFRWCTDRMKIQPTSAYIRQQVATTGRVILLLGVRASESTARARNVKKHGDGDSRLNKHGTLSGCMVFRPIVDFTTDEVWQILLQRKTSPWGAQYRDLITLYRNAEGGECPTMTDKADAPSCGSSSARFGCWTCTVVDKDKSMAGMIEAGFENLEPLMEFRDWLRAIRNEPQRRQTLRRNGRAELGHNGRLIPGPFTLSTRREILRKLMTVAEKTKRELISNDETNRIYSIWAKDAIAELDRRIAYGECAA